MPRPFQRLPFDRLPERPARAHPYFSTAARTLRMQSARFGALDVHYREHGDGPPLLLVHGLMTSSYSWRYVLDGLGARFRLIVPDLPGAGRTGKPNAPLDAASLAEWLGEFQSALGLRGCAAVGNSLGGYLCMRLALADGGAFSRLVNIHSPAFPIARLQALRWALALPGMRALVRFLVRRSPERWVHRNVHYFDETLKSLEEAREYAAPLATDEGRRAFVRYLAETMHPRGFAQFVSTLRRVRFPTPLMLLYARRDPLVPPATGARLAELVPGAPLVWLDDSSHFAHVDSPDRVVPLVLDFL